MLVTALVTPFREGGAHLDLDRLRDLVAFQLEEGVDQVLLAGTTGEGMSLTEDERLALLDAALEAARPEQVMVSVGGGRLQDVVTRGRAVLERGVRDMLLVDCPYNAPSSAALRDAWHGPVAAALGDARLLPYTVPARAGTELLPDDLARLAEQHANVVGVKDATGRLARMERVRDLCGEDFLLLCGDDTHVRDAMIDPDIRAQGACSVVSNLAPRAMSELVANCREGDAAGARVLHDALFRLFGLVCVTTEETVVVRGQSLSVPQRCKNPVPLKEALQELGVDMGACRPPLGALGPAGREHVRALVQETRSRSPDLLRPLGERLVGAGSRAPGELVGGMP